MCLAANANVAIKCPFSTNKIEFDECKNLIIVNILADDHLGFMKSEFYLEIGASGRVYTS